MDNAPDVELLPSTTNIAAAATNPETAANSESPKVIVGRVDVNITEIPPNKIKTAQVIGDVKWVDKTIHHWKAEIREKAVDAPLVDGKKPRPLKVVSMVPIPTTFKAAVYGTRCEFVLKDRKRTETESVSEASSDVTAKVLSSAIRKPRGLIGRDSTTGTVKWTVDLGDTFDDLKSWSIDGSTVTVKFHKAEPMFFDTNTGTRQEPPSDGKHDGAERSKIGVIW